MPVKSEAQRRFMYAAKEGKVKGVLPSVGAEFIEKSKGLKDLPERAEHGKEDHMKGKHKTLKSVGGFC